MTPTKPTYYIVYDWMITEMHLKGGAERDIYALLYSLADKVGVTKVGLQYLSSRTGYTERGIIKAIQSLAEKGWIMTARNSHYGKNEYGVVEPANIIGRFDKSKITSEQSSVENQKTSEQSSVENMNRVQLISEQSSVDTPYIYNFYNKIYNNFFITDLQSEKKEKEILLEEFFNMFGLYQPMDEVMRFWNYHAQTDWRNAKGQRITNKKAAAQFWKIDEQTAHRIPDTIRRILSPTIAAIPQEKRICLIAELERATINETTLTLRFTTETPIHLIEDDPKVMRVFSRQVYRQLGNNAQVNYNFGKQP